MYENRESTSAHFITLTYDAKNVPLTKTVRRSLCKTDLQKFFKRLRMNHSRLQQKIKSYGRKVEKMVYETAPKPIKYLAVGEYGGHSKRPHYHIILFNADVNQLQDAWKLGHIDYGQVSESSVGYTLKYLSKSCHIGKSHKDDRHPTFAIQSKGLGSGYLTQKKLLWHQKDLENRMYLNIPGGQKIAMPRYYKDRIYYRKEREQIAQKALEKSLQELFDQAIKEWDEKEAYSNRKKGIDAAYKNMHRKSIKTKV